MGDVAIRVEGLSKQYRIGGKQERYKTLRDTLTDAFSSPFRRAAQLVRGQAYGAANLNETIWALKDVSFEVKKGEVVGIIGRNGAGKSTLLKILSRITEPTSGYVEVFGRIGALLEVGTGFHPELTGRENIYLNGAILGMTRQEIDRKFDEIVDFAGVEKFIDTPVKHYSSGMGLRLGFAVAAHLEPEILVVDEVLAVGDAQFQKKCLGKMQDVASEGRTVLFVSHNMSAISRITEKCLWLQSGTLVGEGATTDIVIAYLSTTNNDASEPKIGVRKTGLQVTEVLLKDSAGDTLERPLLFGEDFAVCVKWISNFDVEHVAFFMRFEAEDGTIVTTMNSRDVGVEHHLVAGEVVTSEWRPTHNPLLPGNYYITLALHDRLGHPIDHFDHVATFSVSTVGSPARFSRSTASSSRVGYLYLDGTWTLDKGR